MLFFDHIGRIFRKGCSQTASNEAFSLIEILVATAVFLIVSMGVASTMILGLRSTVHTRLTEMGKAAAQQQIEEMRARIFFVPYSIDPDVGTTADNDLLDRYYPNTDTNHVSDDQGWEGWYTETDGDAYYTMESQPDSNTIVLTVQTRFVDIEGNVIAPSSSYNSNVFSEDYPPSDIVEVTVIASWLNRGAEDSYPIVTNISKTDQASTGGSEDAGGEAGCQNSSNSSMDITGGLISVFTGNTEPYTNLVEGTMGKAHVTTSYDCTSTVLADSTGGEWSILNGDIYSGAKTAVSGPPADGDNSGPISVDVTTYWPHLSISQSYAGASVNSYDDTGQLESNADVSISGMNVQLEQVEGFPTEAVTFYQRWDYINPTIAMPTGSSPVSVSASLDQQESVTNATSAVAVGQVEFMPLQAITSDTPSADQGLIFIRNFQADSSSYASESQGSAYNSLTYSATVGIFNTSKPSDCSGDECYDLYEISPTNPLQSAVDLNNSNYRLQKALLTEFESSTYADIDASMYTSGNSDKAMISMDALIKLTGYFGSEVRIKTNGNHDVTVMNEKGGQTLWLGIFDIKVEQDV